VYSTDDDDDDDDDCASWGSCWLHLSKSFLAVEVVQAQLHDPLIFYLAAWKLPAG
jgi:hypothetical protein